jgi:hypothetical protein
MTAAQMTFIEISDDQLESWKEYPGGVALATFRKQVLFTKESGLIIHGNRYRILKIHVGQREVELKRIDLPEPKKRSRPRKKKQAEPPDFQLEGQTYVSHDGFGSIEAGADAALEAGDARYKEDWMDTVHSIVRRPDFIDLVSTDITDVIGLPDGPPKHRSGLVAALMPLSAKETGLVAIGHRKSTDRRHKHVLTVWGFPNGKNPFQKNS